MTPSIGTTYRMSTKYHSVRRVTEIHHTPTGLKVIYIPVSSSGDGSPAKISLEAFERTIVDVVPTPAAPPPQPNAQERHYIEEAMRLIEEHDNRQGNSAELDRAYECLQRLMDTLDEPPPGMMPDGTLNVVGAAQAEDRLEDHARHCEAVEGVITLAGGSGGQWARR